MKVDGAGAAAPAEAGGVEQDSHQVNIELRGGGWIDAIACVRNSWWSGGQYQTEKSGIRFWHVIIGTLVLHHAPAVLVLQGMLLQDLFAPDTHFIDQNTKTVLISRPRGSS